MPYFYSREKAMDCVMYVRQCTYSLQYMRKKCEMKEKKARLNKYWKMPARTKSRTHGAVHNEMANSVCFAQCQFKVAMLMKLNEIQANLLDGTDNCTTQSKTKKKKEKCGTALGNLLLSFIHFCQLFCITWIINFIHLFTLITSLP